MLGTRVPAAYSLLGLLTLLVAFSIANAIFSERWHGAASLSQLSSWVLAAAVFLSLINYALRFLRWNQYLALVARHKISLPRHLLIYIAGFSMTTTPGKLGELSRAAWLSEHGISLSEVTAVFVLERALDVVALLILGSIIVTLLLPEFSEHLIAFGVATIVLATMIGLATVPRLLSRITGRKTRVQRLLTQITDAAQLVGPMQLCLGLLFGLLAWAAEGYACWLIVTDLAPATVVSIVDVVGIYANSLLAGAVTLIPGGLVATELTLGAGLALFDLPVTTILSVVVVTRLITLWFGVLLGFIAMGLLGRPKIRSTDND